MRTLTKTLNEIDMFLYVHVSSIVLSIFFLCMSLVGCNSQPKVSQVQPSSLSSSTSRPFVLHSTNSIVSDASTLQANPEELPCVAITNTPTKPSTFGALEPISISAQHQHSINMRSTGHILTIQGPAMFQPCTVHNPRVFVLAQGIVHIQPNESQVHEAIVATPSFVMTLKKSAVKLSVTPSSSAFEVEDGEISVTNFDSTRTYITKEKSMWPRIENEGAMATRCNVLSSTVAMSTQLLKQQPPLRSNLPVEMSAILQSELIKNSRAKSLECALSQAFSLSCDSRIELNDSKVHCQFSYSAIHDLMQRASITTPLKQGALALPEAGILNIVQVPVPSDAGTFGAEDSSYSQ